MVVCKNNLYCLGSERAPHRLCQDRPAFFLERKDWKQAGLVGFLLERDERGEAASMWSIGSIQLVEWWRDRGQRSPAVTQTSQLDAVRSRRRSGGLFCRKSDTFLNLDQLTVTKSCGAAGEVARSPEALFHTSCSTGLFKAEVTWGINTAFVCALWGISCNTTYTSHTWDSAWRRKTRRWSSLPRKLIAQHNNISTSDLCKVNNSDGCNDDEKVGVVARGSQCNKVRTVRL